MKLYSLVELLDPALLPSEDDFERHNREAPGLSRLVERLSQHGFPIPGQEPCETTSQVAKWLELDEDVVRHRLSAGREERESLLDELADRHLLSEVMIRNRKAVVGGFKPRVAGRWEVDLTDSERFALDAVGEYVQYGFQVAEGANDRTIGFVMVTFQKLMASSIAAIRESLIKRRERVQALATQSFVSKDELEESIDDDYEAGDVLASVGKGADRELAFLDRALSALGQVTIDSKARVLIDQTVEAIQRRSRCKGLAVYAIQGNSTLPRGAPHRPRLGGEHFPRTDEATGQG